MATKNTAPVKQEETKAHFEELASENIIAMTAALKTSSETIETLANKVTSLACHVTALEALLTEVIRITGVDLVQVNQTIRAKIQVVGGEPADMNAVVDIAASLASPGAKKG